MQVLRKDIQKTFYVTLSNIKTIYKYKIKAIIQAKRESEHKTII